MPFSPALPWAKLPATTLMMNQRQLTPSAVSRHSRRALPRLRCRRRKAGPWKSRLSHSHSALLAVLLLALTACEKPATRQRVETPQTLPMEAPEAAELARTLANRQALALYRCEPFINGPSVVWTNEHWFWRARQGLGDGDMEAVVSLAADGSTQSVQVLLLHSSVR